MYVPDDRAGVWALPVYLLLLFLFVAIKFRESVLLGLLSGFISALAFTGSEPIAVSEPIIVFSGTGVLTGITFWLVLKTGNADVPG